MKRSLQGASLPVLAVLLQCVAGARAQSIPADPGATPPGPGFSLPRIGGSLTYGLTAGEFFSNGFYGNNGVGYTTNLSGDLAYVSKSQFHPFSAVYDGGVLIANSGQPNTIFQSLSFSQVLSTKRWTINIADAVSYLPESPVAGLSGIPGVGDVGVDPISIGPNSGIGVLTNYGPRVSNTATLTVSRELTGHLSAQANGVYALQRFVGDNAGIGINSTTESGSAGLTYAFSVRDSLSANYNYSNFSYPGTLYSFSSQGATVQYSHQWSRRLTTSAYAGPQIIGGNSAAYNGTSVELAAGANASYSTRTTSYSLGYSRGVNNGSGVVPGSFSDNVILAAHRQFGRAWALSGDLGYSRTTALPDFSLFGYNGNSLSFSGQATRGLGRYFSAYASYTLARQTTSASTAAFDVPNAFNGLYQTVGIGITYSPRNILLNK